MRISISGAFSTGKTTLAHSAVNGVSGSGRGHIHVIAEVARNVLEMGYQLDKNASLDSYLAYISLQLEAERSAKHQAHVLADRSLIDLLAHVRVNADPAIPIWFDRLLAEIVWTETEYFDRYCYIPIEFSPTVDGIRCVDPTYQRLVDIELVKLLGDFGVQQFQVSGTIEQRTRQLTNIMLSTSN